jgi:hypothetical protein
MPVSLQVFNSLLAAPGVVFGGFFIYEPGIVVVIGDATNLLGRGLKFQW